MKRTYLLTLLALGLGACSSDPLQLENDPVPADAAAHVHPALGTTFELRPGEVASVGGGELFVAFRGVTADSRCPVDVQCVWAGDAELTIGVATAGGVWNWSALHTGVEPRTRDVNAFTVEVVGLEPATRSDASIPPSAYVARLRITRD